AEDAMEPKVETNQDANQKDKVSSKRKSPDEDPKKSFVDAHGWPRDFTASLIKQRYRLENKPAISQLQEQIVRGIKGSWDTTIDVKEYSPMVVQVVMDDLFRFGFKVSLGPDWKLRVWIGPC